ncbi:MAG TPA: PPC domain-containing DNA-binding protein [Bryobacteraceae bacterium]|nr:PPC domain-containing DNA-binding protein [Bryobacteraceae bacterium]
MQGNYFACGALVLFLTATPGRGADPNVRTFGAAQVQEVFRVLLDRDALLLESIADVIHQKDIQDGEVLVTAGSVQECTFHYVSSTAMKPKNAYKTVKGPYEILNAGGIIAAGEPHIHITLSSLGKDTTGGHLEKGCRVLYLAEVTILKYSGPPLLRKVNQNGVSLLEAK